MNPIPPLRLPSGFAVIEDEVAARFALKILGVPAPSPNAAGDSRPVSRFMLYEHHPKHWLLMGAHAGYPDPAKNGHEIACLSRDQVTEQEARRTFEVVASMSARGGMIRVGLIGIPE